MRIAALLLCSVVAAAGADLSARLASLVETASTEVKGAVGVHVVDLSSGKAVFEHNENQLFLPASNLKLFTAALALTRLGPDFRYETRIVREPSGALALVGSGDPSMSARVYPYGAAGTRSSMQAIEELADQVVAAGIRRVDGDIIGDDRHYPWSPYPESWTADDATRDFGAPVSALTFNDNIVTLNLRPALQAGGLARVDVDPGFEYFSIDNRVTTSTGDATGVRVTRIPNTRQLILTGGLKLNAPATRVVVPVEDPALFAARALYEALVRRGVSVRGAPAARHQVSEVTEPLAGEVVATRSSPPLSELLQMAIKVSQNLHVEMFLREVGAYRQGQGSLAAGMRELRALLTELKISQADVVSEDGSGLARNDEVTPRALTQLLTAMYKGGHREVWQSLLPVGGQDGTLGARLCCTSEAVSIRAKTGSLSRAVSLSGYAESRSNGRLAFSILVNNFAAPSADVRAWVDRVATALVE